MNVKRIHSIPHWKVYEVGTETAGTQHRFRCSTTAFASEGLARLGAEWAAEVFIQSLVAREGVFVEPRRVTKRPLDGQAASPMRDCIEVHYTRPPAPVARLMPRPGTSWPEKAYFFWYADELSLEVVGDVDAQP